MCDGGDEGSSGGSTGGIGFSDTSAAEAASQAEGKTAAGGLSEGSVDEQIADIRKKDKDKAKAKKDDKTGQVIGTIVGALTPIPGGAVIGGATGAFIDTQRQKGGLQTGSGAGAGSPGEGAGGTGGEGGEREMTSFPSREAAAKTVLASEQDKRRALRGRKATILTSPRGVTTEAPGRKTLLGQ